uniref:Ubiquitin-like domain-containing protein n=1 Tax=Rhabditophanes sp. KR3021 TaxID=114890 RepID=A0AC35UDT7_9BILA
MDNREISTSNMDIVIGGEHADDRKRIADYNLDDGDEIGLEDTIFTKMNLTVTDLNGKCFSIEVYHSDTIHDIVKYCILI